MPGPHVERMETEFQELETKRIALGNFLSTNTFSGLGKRDRDLLHVQYDAMSTYSRILLMRLEIARE